MIEDNLACVRQKIEQAKQRSGRTDEVALVGISKNVGADLVEKAIEAGLEDIGENRIQEAQEKFDKIGPKVRWHMVGHLQTNKAKQAVKMFDLIHSVDSQRIASALNKEAEKIEKIQKILVEVNTSAEISKYGISPNKVIDFLKDLSGLPNIKITGLMTMAPEVDDPELARPFFIILRELKEKIEKAKIPSVEMKYLSMGMSQDYEVAVEEGANVLRVGTAIFKY
ncbi:YggS family pyridoxal phosphate-dependent enzyme [Candidatus Woesearchaeota archaeon]|nr:YggS family pyridoxal phosphate-dependent enzyme [Candidatus Woesearchaeota archaeon]